MAQNKFLQLSTNGRGFQLSFKKYEGAYVSSDVHVSLDICTDKLQLPSGQSVGSFKERVRAEFNSQTKSQGQRLDVLQNQAAQREFKHLFADIISQQQEALRQRYQKAQALSIRNQKVAELRACAEQGHVQAMLDLAVLLAEEHNPACVGFFVEAHNHGHAESLLSLSKALLGRKEVGEALQVLLLGAWCGSIRCGMALEVFRKSMRHLLETPAALSMLEEARSYGSIHAKYLLGFVLLHGKRCRDEVRGRAVMEEAGNVRHFRADKGKGMPLVGGEQPAGTLAHFEFLIDQELRALRSKEMRPAFLAEAAQMSFEGEQGRDAFVSLLKKYDPVPARMTRKVVDWYNEAPDKPVDEKKRQRMEALFAASEAFLSKESGHA